MAVGFSQFFRPEHSLGQGMWQTKGTYSMWRAGSGVCVGSGPWQGGGDDMGDSEAQWLQLQFLLIQDGHGPWCHGSFCESQSVKV